MNNTSFDIIFFDCDSTLSAVEGIDELARRANVAEQLIPLTTAAMEGSILLEDIYQKRLDVIRPQQSDINWLSKIYVDKLVEGALDVINKLHNLGKDIHIISGGLRQAVLHVGNRLAIPASNVHAVDLRLSADGSYLGFDSDSPLARAGGKAEVCRQLTANSKHAALIGDGITDLEAADAGVFVIGFGGVKRRGVMVENADAFVNGPSLQGVLEHVLTDNELNQV